MQIELKCLKSQKCARFQKKKKYFLLCDPLLRTAEPKIIYTLASISYDKLIKRMSKQFVSFLSKNTFFTPRTTLINI